jgi:flagellar biosynthesis/type III secretory pathway protein FliH
MATSPLTPVDRRRQPLAVALTVAVVGIGAALAGHALGQASSDDLGDVRHDAAAQGARAGAEQGARRGYDSGFKAGRRQGFEQTYQRAFDAQLKKAGLTP